MSAARPPSNTVLPADYETAEKLDLTGTTCPMAFVKTSIFLDSQENGDTVKLLYDASPANEPLARSIEALGHKIIANEHLEETAQKELIIRVNQE